MHATASWSWRREAGESSSDGRTVTSERPVDRIMRRMAVGREGVSPVSGSGLRAAQASMISMSGGYRRTVVLLTTGTVSRWLGRRRRLRSPSGRVAVPGS